MTMVATEQSELKEYRDILQKGFADIAIYSGVSVRYIGLGEDFLNNPHCRDIVSAQDIEYVMGIVRRGKLVKKAIKHLYNETFSDGVHLESLCYDLGYIGGMLYKFNL